MSLEPLQNSTQPQDWTNLTAPAFKYELNDVEDIRFPLNQTGDRFVEQEHRQTISRIFNLRRILPENANIIVPEIQSIYEKFSDIGSIAQEVVLAYRKLGRYEEAYQIALKSILQEFELGFFVIFIHLCSETNRNEHVEWGKEIVAKRFPERLEFLNRSLLRKTRESRSIREMVSSEDVAPSRSKEISLLNLDFKSRMIELEKDVQNAPEIEKVLQQVRDFKEASLTTIIKAHRLAFKICNYDEALEFIQKGLELTHRKDADLHLHAGLTHYKMGNLSEALSYYKRAAFLNSAAAQNENALGIALKLEKFDDARTFAEALSLRKAPCPPALRFLGALAFERGDFIQARDYLTRAPTGSIDRTSLIILCCLHVMAKDYTAALQTIEPLSGRNFTNQFVRFARTYIELLADMQAEKALPITPSEFFNIFIQNIEESIQALDAIILVRSSGIVEDETLQPYAQSHLSKLARMRAQKLAKDAKDSTEFAGQLHGALRLRTSTFFDHAHRLTPFGMSAKAVSAGASTNKVHGKLFFEK